MSAQSEFLGFLSKLSDRLPSPLATEAAFRFVAFEQYAAFKPLPETLHVFEDEWIRCSEAVKSKMLYALGGSGRVFARKCCITELNRAEANAFFEQNHLMGYARSKFHYGLLYEDRLVAAAAFAAEKDFKQGRSAEMTRFCNAAEIAVTGGLSKLVKHYMRSRQPADIMTYTDSLRDSGGSFFKIGFRLEKQLPPMSFMVHKKSGERIPEAHFKLANDHDSYLPLTIPGSLKWRLRADN